MPWKSNIGAVDFTENSCFRSSSQCDETIADCDRVHCWPGRMRCGQSTRVAQYMGKGRCGTKRSSVRNFAFLLPSAIEVLLHRHSFQKYMNQGYAPYFLFSSDRLRNILYIEYYAWSVTHNAKVWSVSIHNPRHNPCNTTQSMSLLCLKLHWATAPSRNITGKKVFVIIVYVFIHVMIFPLQQIRISTSIARKSTYTLDGNSLEELPDIRSNYCADRIASIMIGYDECFSPKSYRFDSKLSMLWKSIS